ncbi:MAG: sigma-54-dependent Fis family transcriptional regulator [Deltaproteobacteria bacterium]|nr:sigma-54-dependent Fis family transcriptional regulator [Deltaproteobacteria bacterium]
MAELKLNGAGEDEVRTNELTPIILVVDDDPIVCEQLERLLTRSGYAVATANSAYAGLERLAKKDVDLLVTDIRLPGLSGVELTQQVQEKYPDVPVIVITGYADIKTAVEVLKLGASDYIMKPFGASAIQESVQKALRKAQVFTEIRHLRRSLKDTYEFGGMLSMTAEMHRVFETIRTVSSTDMTVLIEGETGTGKELVASAIHHHSPRGDKPFVVINCSGFPEGLLESELFGYERGAFTGADQSRAGKIELAHTGTLFLDEIESMSLTMQAKLLRVLEDRKVHRLGARQPTQVDMRVIAASNVSVSDLVTKGQMRSDFYYRINVIPIYLVPLRERRADIPLLVQDFLHHHPVALQKRVRGISKTALKQLMDYSWPGNIRELQNVLERSIVLTSGRTIENVDLAAKTPSSQLEKTVTSSLPLQEWLDAQEKEYLNEQLAASGWKIGVAAKNCGINVKTLYRKMQRHGLAKVDLKRKGDTFVLNDKGFEDKDLFSQFPPLDRGNRGEV